MRTNEDIEGYLIELDKTFEQLDEGMWRLSDEYEHIDNIVIMHSPPIVIFRVKLMELPNIETRAALCEHLLRLNTEMVAGAYGIEDGAVVIVDTLQSENLDLNEFQASVESLALAIAQHYPILKEYRTATSRDGAEQTVAE